MAEGEYLNYNGRFYKSGDAIITAGNRSFRYGDGFFETMKMIDNHIIFHQLHFERLFHSLAVLQFAVPLYFTPEYLLEQTTALVTKNNHGRLSRIRLTIFRGDGILGDLENNVPNYIIQSWLLPDFPSYPTKGFEIGVYEEARLSADRFSVIKNNNYLPYTMAALWYKKQNLSDALLLNSDNRIAEATTSNVFIIKNDVVITPPLTEGCIAGITRRYLLNALQTENYSCKEDHVCREDIEEADELFLTNSGWHMQWVARCNNKMYKNQQSVVLYNQFIKPLLKQA